MRSRERSSGRPASIPHGRHHLPTDGPLNSAEIVEGVERPMSEIRKAIIATYAVWTARFGIALWRVRSSGDGTSRGDIYTSRDWISASPSARS